MRERLRGCRVADELAQRRPAILRPELQQLLLGHDGAHVRVVVQEALPQIGAVVHVVVGPDQHGLPEDPPQSPDGVLA